MQAHCVRANLAVTASVCSRLDLDHVHRHKQSPFLTSSFCSPLIVPYIMYELCHCPFATVCVIVEVFIRVHSNE